MSVVSTCCKTQGLVFAMWNISPLLASYFNSLADFLIAMICVELSFCTFVPLLFTVIHLSSHAHPQFLVKLNN